MTSHLVFDVALTPADKVVLSNLANDIALTEESKGSTSSTSFSGADVRIHDVKQAGAKQPGMARRHSTTQGDSSLTYLEEKTAHDDGKDIAQLKATNDPNHPDFEPAVFSSVDLRDLHLPAFVDTYLLKPYISWASNVVRNKTDVIMLTHLLIYASTSIPSALYLFYNFTYKHAILHVAMQFWYMGAYTLLMHQHIHARGVLAKRFNLIDKSFPFILDPLMGHTWNTYYYHHVKHHHVEGNGPEDLSSTMRYQRDEFKDFLQYFGRFFIAIWIELSLYFLRKKRPAMALGVMCSELGTYALYYAASCINARATVFVFLLPVMVMRFALMVGNWGQHAFVDTEQPDSDFRSSITLVDVASNRFCYNDGYHTSHHLNPLRHWRDHPVSFLQQKETYVKEGALVFHNIDYVMITIRLFMKDYETLAKCLVPIGDQVHLSMEDRVALLKRLTRRFTEEELREKYPNYKST